MAIWRRHHWRCLFLCTAAVITAFALFYGGERMKMVLEGTRALGDELIPILLLTSTSPTSRRSTMQSPARGKRTHEVQARRNAEEELAQSLIMTET